MRYLNFLMKLVNVLFAVSFPLEKSLQYISIYVLIAYVTVVLKIFIYLFIFVFLGLHLQHMEVPRLGVQLEL